MGDKGKRDKSQHELKKKAKLSLKEKRHLRKEKKQGGAPGLGIQRPE